VRSFAWRVTLNATDFLPFSMLSPLYKSKRVVETISFLSALLISFSRVAISKVSSITTETSITIGGKQGRGLNFTSLLFVFVRAE